MIVGYSLSIVHHLWCIVSKSFKGHIYLPKLLAGSGPNLAGMILIRPSLIIVQMVPVHYISRSQGLKIGFQNEHFKNLLF